MRSSMPCWAGARATSRCGEGRAFTIETVLVSRMVQLALDDLSQSFEAIEPVTMQVERMESSPRFAAIAGPSNIAAVATFRVDMEGRGGKFSVLLPYATIEPVRNKLLQRFMGARPRPHVGGAHGQRTVADQSHRRCRPWREADGAARGHESQGRSDHRFQSEPERCAPGPVRRRPAGDRAYRAAFQKHRRAHGE
jgi:hypothetical protein